MKSCSNWTFPVFSNMFWSGIAQSSSIWRFPLRALASIFWPEAPANLMDFFLLPYFGDEDFFFCFPADGGDASHYIKSTLRSTV
jgi:hypothetical protein